VVLIGVMSFAQLWDGLKKQVNSMNTEKIMMDTGLASFL